MTVIREGEWHRWFAWKPVWDRWDPTRVTLLWLRVIERRRVSHLEAPDWWGDRAEGEYWQYRPVSKT